MVGLFKARARQSLTFGCKFAGAKLDSLFSAGVFEDFSQIQSWIREKRLEKAVPSVQWNSPASFKKAEFFSTLKSALKATRDNRVYGLWLKEQGFLGLTPELLFELDPTHRELQTMALAGTGERESDLLRDPKEMQEHTFVILKIIERLRQLGATVQQSPTQQRNFGSLSHLKTEIHAHFSRPVSEVSLLNALHPTPALGVFSEKEDFHILKSLKGSRLREKMGAPFVVALPDGRIQAWVAIRNVQWSATGLNVSVGCGIVEASDLEREWSELGKKKDFVMRSLGFE